MFIYTVNDVVSLVLLALLAFFVLSYLVLVGIDKIIRKVKGKRNA